MKFLLFMMACSSLSASCNKDALTERWALSFNMKGEQVDIIGNISTKVTKQCGFYQYNIKAHKGTEYYEINITSDGELKPMTYIMVGQPTISIQGRCTFRCATNTITGPFVPHSLRIYVDSFIDNRIVGRFEGDSITNGVINVQMPYLSLDQ